MKNGVSTLDRCYLGSLSKSLINIINASETRPDFLEPILIDELESKINLRQNILDEIKDSPYATLIARLIVLSRKLSFGWSGERHYLIKQASCPHCTKRIAIRFIRIGNNPDYNDGKYNIERLDIEKGNSELTSYFGDRNPAHKGMLDGIYKGSLKIKSDTFTDNFEESKFKPKKNNKNRRKL